MKKAILTLEFQDEASETKIVLSHKTKNKQTL